MVELLAINGHVVASEHAARVIAPPYDAVSAEQRATIADEPDRFLSVLPASQANDAELEENRQAWERLRRTGRFVPLPDACLGVLELEHGGRRTVGVIGDVPVEAFLDGRVLPHEHVQPDRVRDLARHLEVVGLSSSPVCVLHRPSSAIDEVVAEVRAAEPTVRARTEDGVGVTLWVVEDPTVQARLTAAVDAVGTLTIADGHHRAAAVARLAADAPERTAGRVLTAVVPTDHLDIHPFHRRIDGLGEVNADEVRAVLAEVGITPTELEGPATPDEAGTVHVTVEGRWFRIDLHDHRGADPVGRLDAAVADREIIGPLRTLGDEVDPAPVVPVSGPSGLDALVAPGAVGVALHPPSLDELLEVAAAGEAMPYKSTYLTPKLRSGIVVVPR